MKSNDITVSIIGCTGVPAKYGGFETLAEQLCIHLHDKISLNIFSSSKVYSKQEKQTKWEYGNRIFIPIKANGISSILYDLISLFKAVRISDTILILGGSGGLFLPLVKFLYRKKMYIFHPDGLEWKRKKWNLFSKLFLLASICTASRFADRIIVDNSALLPFYKRCRKKVVVIEYGGDQFNLDNDINMPEKKFWLTIARAEPENNLLLIGNAFKQLKEMHWICIANWDKTKYGKILTSELNEIPNIKLIHAIYDKKIISGFLKSCSGYIHGHSNGGTNPTLVSALWLNKPVLCHDNTFNRSSTRNLAYYFSDMEELINLLKQPDIKPDDRILKLAHKKYQWKTITEKYYKLFCSDKIC